MNRIAIAILAHPDDAEFLCAGTLLRLRTEHGWAKSPQFKQWSNYAE